MTKVREILQANLHRVEAAIASACQKSSRARQEVQLVAVTKTVPPEVVGLLPELGVLHLGESRPQELWRKAPLLPATVHWHQIGHLQSNKLDKTLPLVHLIHSVDSLRLLQAIEKEATKQQRTVSVLLEVNASGESNKHGFAPEELPGIMPALASLQRVQVRGLMTLAAYEENPELCRPTFVRLRELRERLAKAVKPPHSLQHLSMGMSNDFTVAIEEGATLIRLGTILFEGFAAGTT